MPKSKKEPNIFKGFSPYSKPYAPYAPKKTYTRFQPVEEYETDGGGTVTLGNGTVLHIDSELDYSGCYYEGDTPSIKVKIRLGGNEEIPNPNYEKEYTRYLKEKEKYKIALKKWNELKTLWDEKQAAKTENYEKALLKKLKDKYEKSKS